MKYMEMKKLLNELNKKWGLDFVSATAGDCCNTCGDMRTPKETEKWENAETYLVIKWFFKGMNYSGRFEDDKHLFIKYNLGNLDINEVCKDLQTALNGKYKIKTPEDSMSCIELISLQ